MLRNLVSNNTSFKSKTKTFNCVNSWNVTQCKFILRVHCTLYCRELMRHVVTFSVHFLNFYLKRTTINLNFKFTEMVLKTTNKLIIFFLILCAQVACARFNAFRSRYLQPRQQDEGSQGYYQNGDMIKCPGDTSGWLSFFIEAGVYTEVWKAGSIKDVILHRSEPVFHQGGAGYGPPYRAKIREKFEVEPPTVCPVLEVELHALWTHPDKVLCFLMWDEFKYSNKPSYHPPDDTVFIHTKCPDMGDPEEVDNPKRIFTLIPYKRANCDASIYWHCIKYKLCPLKNTSCESPALALGELGGHPRFSVQVPKTGRTYNMGGYSVFKPEAYYDYYDSPIDSYQNDDACLSSMNGIISFDLNGKRCLFSYLFENTVIMYPEYGTRPSSRSTTYCNSDPNTIFTLEVRQIYEPAPPNPCPVIEAEIRFRTDLTDVKCALLWDNSYFTGNYLQDFIHPICTGLDNPESLADNNPNRIFTLITQPGTSTVNGENFVDYKLCPGQNQSCGELVVIATQFEWLVDMRTWWYFEN